MRVWKKLRRTGSELDMEKAARLLLDDFRNGRIGRITLEFPQDYEETDGE